MSINLSDSVAVIVAETARRQGVSVSELIRRGIGVEMWRDGVERRGGHVLVESAMGRVRQVEFCA
jgi:sensor histidine kinase regulating citrate/malate metabolism